MGNRRHRRLVTPTGTYHWVVRHRHTRLVDEDGRPSLLDCRETVLLRRDADGPPRNPPGVEVVFRPGPGRLVGDLFQASGTAVRADDRASLNLNRPGVVRAIIDELTARGTDFTEAAEVDGWDLFDAVWEETRPGD